MGKNYTLYINKSNFQNEPNKSGLINKLLSEHYKSIPNNPPTKNIIKTPADAKKAVEKTKPITYTPKTNWGA